MHHLVQPRQQDTSFFSEFSPLHSLSTYCFPKTPCLLGVLRLCQSTRSPENLQGSQHGLRILVAAQANVNRTLAPRTHLINLLRAAQAHKDYTRTQPS